MLQCVWKDVEVVFFIATCNKQQLLCRLFGNVLPRVVMSFCSAEVLPQGLSLAAILGLLKYWHGKSVCVYCTGMQALALQHVDQCRGRGHSSELSAVSQKH